MGTSKKGPRKKSNSGKQSKQEDASWIDTDRVVNKAQRIVNSAVNVLEEEIAAGILAAKKIEKKLIDVDEIREDPDALMNRIRRDSHEVLDLFIDAFASLTGQMNSVVEALKKETEEQAKKNGKASSTKPPSKTSKSTPAIITLEPDAPMKPGETVTLTISMFEDHLESPKKIELRKSDLIGPGEHVIYKRAIKIEPKSFSLRPKKEKDLNITLDLPKNSQPGCYNALLTDKNDPLVRVLIALEVI
ncbi:hypothetical protein [uncultured Marixanthomonas sp.]|uniref:hypothetical protein n=1 Tax=uncultured Marixanthomonas sp. TaxID=757245 RepID=UPI0030D9B61F|tara:strand:+ start:22480 stop:23217 length:738 start_codon:yes stop_codon:yes gene_type:complete